MLGRFFQSDPIRYGDGMNLYAYSANDSVNFRDPSGFARDDPWPPPKRDGGGGTCYMCSWTGGSAAALGVGSVWTVYRLIESDTKIFRGFKWVPGCDLCNGQGFTLASAPTPTPADQAAFLRDAVVDAMTRRCRCNVDDQNIEVLNPNMVRVNNTRNLPNIFQVGSLSSHARSYVSSIPGSTYVLKLYINDTSAQCGGNCLTITTPLSDPNHYINVPFFYMGLPINTYNARQYCLQVGCRFVR